MKTKQIVIEKGKEKMGEKSQELKRLTRERENWKKKLKKKKRSQKKQKNKKQKNKNGWKNK